MGTRIAASTRWNLAAAVLVVGAAVAVMIAAPDNLIDVSLADLGGPSFVALAAVIPVIAGEEEHYADVQLVGQVFTGEEIGDFLVCGTAQGHVHFYRVETCEIGRIEASVFTRAVRYGLIRWQEDLSHLVRCPGCSGRLEVVLNGQVNGQPEPFVSCTSCAFAEELL